MDQELQEFRVPTCIKLLGHFQQAFLGMKLYPKRFVNQDPKWVHPRKVAILARHFYWNDMTMAHQTHTDLRSQFNGNGGTFAEFNCHRTKGSIRI
jgi:hypothetical protein